jgi:hypothetical protein
MKVNEMHVATSASSVTGLSPSLVAIPSATGVMIDPAAAFVIRFVMIVVVTANTTTRTIMLPEETCSIARASWSAKPLSTTIAPSPTDPARMNSTFQSRARTAMRGVSTRVSTMSSAPAKDQLDGCQAERRRDDDRGQDAQRSPGLAGLRRATGRLRPQGEGVVAGQLLGARAGDEDRGSGYGGGVPQRLGRLRGDDPHLIVLELEKGAVLTGSDRDRIQVLGREAETRRLPQSPDADLARREHQPVARLDGLPGRDQLALPHDPLEHVLLGALDADVRRPSPDGDRL